MHLSWLVTLMRLVWTDYCVVGSDDCGTGQAMAIQPHPRAQPPKGATNSTTSHTRESRLQPLHRRRRRRTSPPWPWRRLSESSPPTRSAATSRSPASRRSTTWYGTARFLIHFRGTAPRRDSVLIFLPTPLERREDSWGGADSFFSDLVWPFWVRRRPCRRRRRDPVLPYVLITLF